MMWIGGDNPTVKFRLIKARNPRFRGRGLNGGFVLRGSFVFLLPIIASVVMLYSVYSGAFFEGLDYLIVLP